jgi:hypothetical protein
LDDLHPDNIPETCGKPKIYERCQKVETVHSDFIERLPDNRIRIRRKWEVKDPCNGIIAQNQFLYARVEPSAQLNAQFPPEGFVLYQNKPNPFTEGTMIGFFLPESTSATLTIQDINGRVLHTFQKEFPNGYNEVEIKADQLPSSGMLWYTVVTPTHKASKRMVIIKD